MSIKSQADKIREELEAKENVKVRIALFGKSGVGKSTLINKLVGHRVAQEGVKTDTTTEVFEYEWEGIHLVDLPGYGTTKYAADQYIQHFNIIEYDLFICVLTDRIMADDVKQFQLLKEQGKTCVFVRNKHDQIWQEGAEIHELEKQIEQDLQTQIQSKEKLYFVSCRTNYGLDKLGKVILQSLDDAKQERWARSAKAYSADFLEQKKKVCNELVRNYAALAAANGLNPLPGADITVDIGIMLKLFSHIKTSFGLTDDVLKSKEMILPTVAHMAKNVLEFATREGIVMLMKRYVSKVGAKTISKYIPFVGQAIAASLGFAVTYQAGKSYLSDCINIAELVLERELARQAAY
jgi:small GTP-binding protein